MKKSYVFAPAGALAIGAAALFLYRKKKTADSRAVKSTPKSGGGSTAMNRKSGTYSFASGYKDAKTVEVRFDYDGEKFSYAVASEDFVAETSDSHVGILRGEDFSVQLEYTAYFGGEDFDALEKHISDRYKGFGQVCCGETKGIKYFDGKSLCLAFPAAPADYLLVSIVIAGDDGDDEYLKLWDNDELQAILATLTITAR